jgi:hypothetical protein
MNDHHVNILYHLTPQGWVVGNVNMFADLNLTVEPPADSVETWEHEIYQSSGSPSEEDSWHMVWSSPAVSADDRKALHEKFPHEQDRGPGG